MGDHEHIQTLVSHRLGSLVQRLHHLTRKVGDHELNQLPVSHKVDGLVQALHRLVRIVGKEAREGGDMFTGGVVGEVAGKVLQESNDTKTSFYNMQSRLLEFELVCLSTAAKGHTTTT